MLYILVIVFSIIFYMLGAATVRYKFFPYPQLISIKNNLPIDKSEQYLNNKFVALHKIYKTEQADIVMLGDSLTNNINWSELFNLHIINRGVGGDVTDGYLHRMEYVYKLKPKKVFVNGGTNDFKAGYSINEVFNNYKQIIKLLKEHNIKPYIQSVIYTSFDEINVKNKALNDLLEKYCLDNVIEYINLNKNLSVNQKLLDKHTIDGSHLSAEGYMVWKEEIEKHIVSNI